MFRREWSDERRRTDRFGNSFDYVSLISITQMATTIATETTGRASIAGTEATGFPRFDGRDFRVGNVVHLIIHIGRKKAASESPKGSRRPQQRIPASGSV